MSTTAIYGFDSCSRRQQQGCWDLGQQVDLEVLE